MLSSNVLSQVFIVKHCTMLRKTLIAMWHRCYARIILVQNSFNVSLNFSRLLLSLVSGDRRLKAKGDNAVRWRHESNVVIYEISHATFGTDSQLQKHLRLDKTNEVSKDYSGPLVEIIILLPACSVSLRNTLELNIPWVDVDRVFQRPCACMSDLESNQIHTRTKSFLYLRLRTEQNFQ